MRESLKKMIRKPAKAGLFGAVCLATVLVIFEGLYRYQVIDTYRPELNGFNRPEDLKTTTERPTVLFMGDSFTAGATSYPAIIREAQDRYRVINAGVGGTGIIETNILAQRRFKQFKPSIFVYQVYAGNDLLDIRYPVNWKKLPVIRNVYWMVAQRFRSIAFLNYRLGQLAHAQPTTDQKAPAAAGQQPVDIFSDIPFNPRIYYYRERVHFAAEPGRVEDSVLVQGGRKKDFQRFLKGLHHLLSSYPPPGCRVFVLVIPHCAQVSEDYLHNMQAIGATFREPQKVLANQYPFLTQMRQYLDQHGMQSVRILNPIPMLKQHEAQGHHVYYQNDLHLNPYGQMVMAQYVLEQIGLTDPAESRAAPGNLENLEKLESNRKAIHQPQTITKSINLRQKPVLMRYYDVH